MNLDPIALLAPIPEIDRRVKEIILAAGDTGHVFNLGHGILPMTPVENAVALVEAVAVPVIASLNGTSLGGWLEYASLIEKAGADREKVRDAIENMKGFIGTAGVFTFSPADHNGLDINAFEMLTVKDGKFVPLAK